MLSDEKWMRRALLLAARGRGWVHPNPLVGAVVVRNGRVVGEGYHRAFGLPHAEVQALRAAGKKARGATLYVSLEPCCHWGKTPPCTNAILEAGVRRVVAAMRDPNPRVAGGGFARLKRRGIQVKSDVLAGEARSLNRAFLSWIAHQRPYVIVKMATSLDGRSVTVGGESKWITGPESRKDGYQLRAEVDAIAVGVETVRADNPSLTAHGYGANPIRMIFDSQLRTPKQARVLNREAPTWIFTGTRAPSALRARFERLGVLVHEISRARDGRVDLKQALKDMSTGGVGTLLVEGGSTLVNAFLNLGAVDEVEWYLAPMVLGQQPKLSKVPRLEQVQVVRIGQDWRMKGRYVHRAH